MEYLLPPPSLNFFLGHTHTHTKGQKAIFTAKHPLCLETSLGSQDNGLPHLICRHPTLQTAEAAASPMPKTDQALNRRKDKKSIEK